MKLIKRLFIACIALFVLAGIGLYIFISTFDANQYKPLIVEKASEATGRTVDFSDISLQMSLSQGIRAALNGLTISENPAYGQGDFVKVGKIFVGVDVLAYLTKKEIALTAITVESPDITLIKGKDGVLNAATIGKPKEAAPQAAPEKDSPSATALPAVMVDKLTINNGTLTFIDQSQTPPLKATVNSVDFAVNGFSLKDSFDVSLKLAAFAAKQNIALNGKVKLDLAKQGAEVSGFSTTLDLTGTDIAQLKALPMLKGKPLPDVLNGKLTATLQQLSFSKDGGLGEILADVKLENGAVKITPAPGTVVDIPSLAADIKGFSLAGKQFSYKVDAAYGGTQQNVALAGKASFNQQTGAVSLADSTIAIDFTRLSLGDLKSTIAALKDKPLPDKLAGKLNASIKQFAFADGKVGSYTGDISFTDGAVAFNELSPGVALDIPSIHFTLKDVAPGKAGSYDLKLAYLSSTPNIFSTGNVAVDTAGGGVTISNGTLNTELSSLSLDKLKASIAALKDANLPQNLKGKLAISGLQAKAGGGTPATYAGTLTLADGAARLTQPPAPLENINATIGFNQSDLDIQSLSLNLGKGSITAKGKVADYTASKRFALTLAAKDIAVESLLDQSQAKEKAQGLITANASVSGTAAQLDTTLNGKADVNLKDGKLLNVNVLARVLEKVNIIPGMQGIAQANLPRTWQQKLQKSDTEITKLEAATTITNGVASITPINLEAEGFLFNGRGSYALASKAYALDGSFIMPPDMAAEMAGAVKEMQYLMNAQKEIRFPLKVEGAVGGKTSFSPDIGSVARDALQNKGKDQLMRVLDKKLNKDGQNDGMNLLKGVLGAPQGEQPTSPQEAPASQQQVPASQQPQQQPAAQPQSQQQISPEQQLMQGVLKGLMR